MSKSFNRFYADVSVLKAETPDLVDARLALVAAFGKTLAKGLDLLGITPPTRM
jgi:arginyl-tRNA synthetase